MRPDLCVVVFCLAIFAGSSANWAQENKSKTPAPPPRALAQPAADDASPKKFSEADVASEFKRLSGKWRPINAVLAGNALSREICEKIQLELSNGRFKSTANEVASSGKVALDLANEPRAMDITFEDGPEAGKTIKCVYKFEDEKLHVAYSLSFDDVRPALFESNQDNKQLLIVYERLDGAKPIRSDAKASTTNRNP